MFDAVLILSLMVPHRERESDRLLHLARLCFAHSPAGEFGIEWMNRGFEYEAMAMDARARELGITR
jgi:hypothetical protein